MRPIFMYDNSKLRCPICKNTLSGTEHLLCERCDKTYPVVDGIPVMLSQVQSVDGEQDLPIERDFYERMFAGVTGVDDGHCIVYGHDKIYDFVSRAEPGTLLEAGCGGGHNGVNLAKRGFKVTAVDLTMNGVKVARTLAEHEHQQVEYVCADIKQLPFADNEFDTCFCGLVLHHFVALENVIHELARVTRRRFIAFEVNAWDPLSFFRFNVLNPAFGLRNVSKNQRALFPRALCETLSRHGFRDFVVEYEDMHDYLGKSPQSFNAKLIRSYQAALSVLPKKFSSNKFLLRATK